VYQYTVNRFARASRALRSPVRPMRQILDLPLPLLSVIFCTSRFPIKPPTYIIKHAGVNQIATRMPRDCSSPACCCSQPASQLV